MTGTSGPLRCAARDSEAASAVGVNTPVATVPLACRARKPGCAPNTRVVVSIACAGVRAISARPYLTRVKLMPAAWRRAIKASPMATAEVTWPAVTGSSSRARHNADSASILEVSP